MPSKEGGLEPPYEPWLSFKSYIENICRTVKYKLHVLQGIRKHLSTDKAKISYNAFISSQF